MISPNKLNTYASLFVGMLVFVVVLLWFQWRHDRARAVPAPSPVNVGPLINATTIIPVHTSEVVKSVTYVQPDHTPRVEPVHRSVDAQIWWTEANQCYIYVVLPNDYRIDVTLQTKVCADLGMVPK